MKAYWKRAYSLYSQYTKQVDVASVAVGPRTLDGPLRDSAVARLLVDGKLPAEGAAYISTDDPMDLSSKSRLLSPNGPPSPLQHVIKPEPADNDRFHELSVEMLRININNEMEKLKQGFDSEENCSTWKCRYCPFMAPTPSILYSHYQFHQQLLTSQSSRPHIEWLTAYRRAKEAEETLEDGDSQGNKVPMFGYPPKGLPPSHPGSAFSLRNLLENKNTNNQQSASGFLRSIVQAVMQQGSAPGQGQSTSSIYDSLVNNQDPNKQSNQMPQHETSSPELLQQPGEVPHEGGEIKRKGSKRKAAAPSTPAVMPKYPTTTERERKYSLTNQMVCDIGSTNNGITPHEGIGMHRSASMVSLGSRSNTSSPISVGGDIPLIPRSHSANSLISEDGVHINNYKLSLPEASKSQFNSPSDFQRTALSPALSWSDADSDQVRNNIQLPRRSKSERRSSVDSDVSNISSVSREINSCKDQISANLQVGSPAHSSPMYQFPVSQQPFNSYSDSENVERSKFDFTSMSKTYDNVQTEPSTTDDDNGNRAVQCELLISPGSDDTQSEEMDGLSSGPKKKGVIKCEHCGISFEDEVLHSIHMGCHSHTDPFKCNVCGRSCVNRYGFYTHIMRGHHP